MNSSSSYLIVFAYKTYFEYSVLKSRLSNVVLFDDFDVVVDNAQDAVWYSAVTRAGQLSTIMVSLQLGWVNRKAG